MKLATLTKPDWRRGATFNHLSKVIKGQTKNYTSADLVTVVANELPISTESAMEEAEGAGDKLMKDCFDGRNLEGSHFTCCRHCHHLHYNNDRFLELHSIIELTPFNN